MSDNSSAVKALNIKEILTKEYYIIPIYQRNYAWGREEITQLIQDIWSSISNNEEKNYYIGTLVTHKRGDGKYEILDGQQRLTTLYILVSFLKEEIIKELNLKLNLYFEAREGARDTLNNLLDGNIEGKEASIIDSFNFIKEYFEYNQIDREKFIKYFLKKVILIHTIVSSDTGLIYYFEIMNNRGEQLEKHEISKARLISSTGKEDREKYSSIWYNCSQMDKKIESDEKIRVM